MLERIHIILVEPSHPGNIGSVARAMKNMGLARLTLVSPKFFPDPQAEALAARATDVLDNATVVATLSEAIASSGLTFGFSGQPMRLPWPLIEVRQAALLAQINCDQQKVSEVAMVFGRERCGLYLEELQWCDYQVSIPANWEYASLNLAQAVQIVAYELRMVALAQKPDARGPAIRLDQAASNAEKAKLLEMIDKVSIASEFVKPHKPSQILPRLKRLLARSRLEKKEAGLLCGLFAAVDKKIASH